MKKTALVLLLLIGISSPLYAAQSTIADVEGNACVGGDKSRKQMEQAALTDAKRRAVEFTSTYLKSETEVKDFLTESKGSVYQVKTRAQDIGLQTRGVKLTGKTDGKSSVTEFYEDKVIIKTAK